MVKLKVLYQIAQRIACTKTFQIQYACYGTPDILITDNGPQFSSNSFKSLPAQSYQFKHLTPIPHFLQSNGHGVAEKGNTNSQTSH